jgi:hypothetical protein
VNSGACHLKNVFTFAANKNVSFMKNEEYVENRGRDWIVFIVSLVGAVALLIWKPEWVWVSFPFVFTALAGAMGRL